MGVLGRLALCYGIGCTLALYLSPRGLIRFSAAALLVYWAVMWWFGSGPDPYSLTTNAALRFDLWLLGPNHLYHGESLNGKSFAFDPEGVLSTLPAVVTFVLGYLAGQFIDRTPDRRLAVSELFPLALLLIAGGCLWDYWFGFPINKKLWTSSYTLLVGGLSMTLLALAIWLVDIKGKGRWLGFFNVFGKNPLLAYVVSELGLVILDLIRVPVEGRRAQTGVEWFYAHTGAALAGDSGLGSFLFSVGYMLICWLISWLCFRRGLILKI